MNTQQQKRIGKFLSLVLRHRPEKIDLQLDEQGWTPVDHLLTQLARHGTQLGREELDYLVATNPKLRYAYNEAGTHIRAQQGHSIQVELGYKPVVPPAYLYHGTVGEFMGSILEFGLEKRNRHHVHLSEDKETATMVGSRRGKAIILSVRAGDMHAAGHEFFQSGNGVWLTESVPPEFLEVPS
ncbi:MAG: RNA 2'-phosphotransferase [Bacteroidota bacterium]